MRSKRNNAHPSTKIGDFPLKDEHCDVEVFQARVAESAHRVLSLMTSPDKATFTQIKSYEIYCVEGARFELAKRV